MVTFTSSAVYWKPLIPRITIKSLDNATTYYTYDPWTDAGTTTKAVACSVNLSQNHQGIFTVQIEDETKAINANVNLGARVIIECGKQSTQMTRLISGLIRQKGYSRGADRKVVYTLSGSSTAIRLNEIITNQQITARKLQSDGITIDTTDPNFVADLLLQNQLAGLTAEGVASAANLITRSDVENFIPSMDVNFGELQDVCNIIEESTNGEIFVDVNDLVQFRHQLQPSIPGRGFAIKNKNAATDNADDTCYLRGKSWDYTESCLKSDSYSSRIWGILQTEPEPSNRESLGFNASTSAATGQDTTHEYAVKFRPPHSHFLPGDIFVVGVLATATPADVPWITRFRICIDNAGVPNSAAGSVKANINFPPDQFQLQTVASPVDVTKVQLGNVQTFYDETGITKIDSFNLDTTKDYWLILSNDNLPGVNRTFYWAQKFAGVGLGTTALQNNTAGLSTDTGGGTGWTPASGNFSFIYSMPRRRSQAFECTDPKAINAIGTGLSPSGGTRIESTLSNIPASISTKEAMQRYMVNQLYYMARPRSNWNMATVTAPNVPIVPGDPIMISDSVMGFSTAGTQAVMTTCGDMTYSWQIGDYQAPTILSIQPVGLVSRYK